MGWRVRPDPNLDLDSDPGQPALAGWFGNRIGPPKVFVGASGRYPASRCALQEAQLHHVGLQNVHNGIGIFVYRGGQGFKPPHGINGVNEGVKLIRGTSKNQPDKNEHVLVTAGPSTPTISETRRP